MDCPVCQTANHLGANYCKHCGNLLMQACPRCNSQLPDFPNYCDHCGLKLVDSSGYNWWAADQTETAIPPSIAEGRLPGVVRSLDSRTTSVASSPASRRSAPPSRPQQPTSPSAAESQLQQYIPKELLKKLEAARASGTMAGERRVVTMLFCDVKGSTAAADQLDPEERL